jgi:hypothetical protein
VIALLGYVVDAAAATEQLVVCTLQRSFSRTFYRLRRLRLLISVRRLAGGFWETRWRAQPQDDNMLMCMRVCTLAV